MTQAGKWLESLQQFLEHVSPGGSPAYRYPTSLVPVRSYGYTEAFFASACDGKAQQSKGRLTKFGCTEQLQQVRRGDNAENYLGALRSIFWSGYLKNCLIFFCTKNLEPVRGRLLIDDRFADSAESLTNATRTEYLYS